MSSGPDPTSLSEPDSDEPSSESGDSSAARYHVRLPGFTTEQELGLGDVVKKVTSAFGIQPCDGWQRRAAAMNRWMSFSGKQHR